MSKQVKNLWNQSDQSSAPCSKFSFLKKIPMLLFFRKINPVTYEVHSPRLTPPLGSLKFRPKYLARVNLCWEGLNSPTQGSRLFREIGPLCKVVVHTYYHSIRICLSPRAPSSNPTDLRVFWGPSVASPRKTASVKKTLSFVFF